MLHSWLTLTWYPGLLGDDSGTPWVLISESDYVAPGSSLVAMMGQVVETANYARGAQAEHWSRGNKQSRLEVTKLVEAVDPRAGTVAVLSHAASLPSATGWLLIEIDGETTTWALDQVVFEELPGTVRSDAEGFAALTYRFRAGALAVYAGDPPAGTYIEGEVLLEGTDRDALLLEDAA